MEAATTAAGDTPRRPKKFTLDLDGQPIHVADYGGEGTTFVLVHGLGGSLANFAAFGPLTARLGRTIALDLPGFGLSAPTGTVTLELMERAVISLLEHLGGDPLGQARAPVVLVGNSMGGAISIRVAAARPDLVAALILVCPALPQPDLRLLDRRFMLLLGASMMPGYDTFLRMQLRSRGPERMVDEMLSLTCADRSRVPPDAVSSMKEIARIRQGFAWTAAAFSQAARSLVAALSMRERFRSSMKLVRAPTLIVHGARDRLVPVRSALQALVVAPAWRLEVYGDVGHVPQLEVPERLMHTMNGFLLGQGLMLPQSPL